MRTLFFIAALYDGILGLIFLLAGPTVFSISGIEAPNHWGYVQFPALLLLVFALMFFQIARDPIGYRTLIPYGIGLKAAYCLVVFGHYTLATIPSLWIPWALLDFIFLIAFWRAYRMSSRQKTK